MNNTDHSSTIRNMDKPMDYHSCPFLFQGLSDLEYEVDEIKRRITPIQLFKACWKHKSLYVKILSLTFIGCVILTLSVPNYYTCSVMLAPELSGNTKGSTSLSSIASSFGLNLDAAAPGEDAIFPTLYPDLMNSVAFRASLFQVKVQAPINDSTRVEMTYYDYLENKQRLPWWSACMKAVIKWVMSFFSDITPHEGIDPFQLTKEQFSIVENMEDKVMCSVDKKTMVITINVTDQDAYIAATMADSVQRHLQEFITDYRTRKSRIDLEYYKKLFVEAKYNYEKSLNQHAGYADANQRAFLQKVRSNETKLANEVSLQYQAYSQVAAQLKMAEAKVQENTPAFTTLQPATVPVKKAGPKRGLITLSLLFLSFIFTSGFVLYKSKDSF